MSPATLRTLARVVAAIGISAAAACTHVYVPRKYPVANTTIASFANHPTVQMTNTAESRNTIVGSQGAHKWIGDLHTWTDVAIGLLTDELGKRGVTFVTDGKKTLKLSITRAQIFWGFAAIRCILNLHVETGDGHSFEFEGNNASPGTLYRAVDGSVTRAVEALLLSPQVRAYLEAP